MSSDQTYKDEKENKIMDKYTQKIQFVVEMYVSKNDIEESVKAARCRLQSVSGVYSVTVI